MNIEIVEPCGFCAGVKRAIDLAQDALRSYKSVYCLGELIHNETVVSGLKREGLIVIQDLSELEGRDLFDSAVIIRSHGAKKEVYDFLNNHDIAIVDATCTIVKKIQGLCREFSKDGCTTIIFGDKLHHEVQSLMDYCDGRVSVIASVEDVGKDIALDSSILISQSTKDEKQLLDLYEQLFKRGLPKSNFYNTICSDIKTRQKELDSLAGRVDLVLVLGSKQSANTANLFSIAKEKCSKSFLVSDLNELPEVKISESSSIAIATGASTPYNFLNSVTERIKNLYK
ncbi:MAG: 4-hydroxy-3-methylbut-2-enyl diphosphate reductase [Candidatus Kaelpia aquatica]|nr:4-hydroxy-3-methylbut-2-enyl diphosphate reductase [Candidatus Kaelpia aquatica]